MSTTIDSSNMLRFAMALRNRLRNMTWGMHIHPTARIEPGAWIDRTWPKGVHIGADVYIGYQAVILTHDFTRGVYLDTTICEGCIVGARAIIMPGVTVGTRATIQAGAVVTRDVEAGSVVAGNPAQRLDNAY